MKFIMLNSSITTICEPPSPTFKLNTPTSLKLNQFEFVATCPALNQIEIVTSNGKFKIFNNLIL